MQFNSPIIKCTSYKIYTMRHAEFEGYEKSLKEKRNTHLGLSEYYLGYVGRHLAYQEIKKRTLKE